MTISINSKIAGYLQSGRYCMVGDNPVRCPLPDDKYGCGKCDKYQFKDYSNNIALAIEAVEKLGYAWTITSFNKQYHCSINKPFEVAYISDSDTPASALCEALIRAMESK
jgi:hypothetical protein